jgi:hypothetical protein
MIMVLAFTMLGNGLRDAFDIRKEEKKDHKKRPQITQIT